MQCGTTSGWQGASRKPCYAAAAGGDVRLKYPLRTTAQLRQVAKSTSTLTAAAYVTILSHMETEQTAAAWRALANPVRRAMLDVLRDGPCTTTEVAERFPSLSRFAVMQHLRVLEAAELVVPRREGRKRYNYLNAAPIQALYDRWVVRYMQPWTEALLNLRDELELEAREERA